MLTLWTMVVILAYGIFSGVFIISTIVLLGHFGMLPNQDELVGKTLLFWGTVLLVYAYVFHKLTMVLTQPIIDFARKKIHKMY